MICKNLSPPMTDLLAFVLLLISLSVVGNTVLLGYRADIWRVGIP
jgi:hypothetical protein